MEYSKVKYLLYANSIRDNIVISQLLKRNSPKNIDNTRTEPCHRHLVNEDFNI